MFNLYMFSWRLFKKILWRFNLFCLWTTLKFFMLFHKILCSHLPVNKLLNNSPSFPCACVANELWHYFLWWDLHGSVIVMALYSFVSVSVDGTHQRACGCGKRWNLPHWDCSQVFSILWCYCCAVNRCYYTLATNHCCRSRSAHQSCFYQEIWYDFVHQTFLCAYIWERSHIKTTENRHWGWKWFKLILCCYCQDSLILHSFFEIFKVGNFYICLLLFGGDCGQPQWPQKGCLLLCVKLVQLCFICICSFECWKYCNTISVGWYDVTLYDVAIRGSARLLFCRTSWPAVFENSVHRR